MLELWWSWEATDELTVQRLSSRWSCPTCGRAYTRPAYAGGTCPVEGKQLFQRSDDRPEVIRKRLQVFHAQTAPLINFYEKRGLLAHVDGVGTLDEVEERIAKALEAAAK